MPVHKRPTNYLREARLDAGWSQPELSEHSDVGVATISNTENYKTNPSPLTMRKLLKAINSSPRKSKEWKLKDIFPNSKE